MFPMHSICHYEIPSTDFAKSKVFYESLFDWKLTEMPDGSYMVFEIEGGIGGGFNKVEQATADGIQIYIHVADIPATLAKAEELGGKTAKAKTSISEHGNYALFTDPCGAQIGIWSRE